MHPTDGTALKTSFSLVVGIHDVTGRLIATEEQSFDEDSFFGFESFEMNLYLPTEEFTRLRVYPKAL